MRSPQGKMTPPTFRPYRGRGPAMSDISEDDNFLRPNFAKKHNERVDQETVVDGMRCASPEFSDTFSEGEICISENKHNQPSSSSSSSLRVSTTLEAMKLQKARTGREIVRDWFRETLNVELPTSSDEALVEELKDGVLLCHIMNFVRKGSVPKIVEDANINFQAIENVDAFLVASQDFGMKKYEVFERADLVSNPRLVIQCICHLRDRYQAAADEYREEHSSTAQSHWRTEKELYMRPPDAKDFREARRYSVDTISEADKLKRGSRSRSARRRSNEPSSDGHVRSMSPADQAQLANVSDIQHTDMPVNRCISPGVEQHELHAVVGMILKEHLKNLHHMDVDDEMRNSFRETMKSPPRNSKPPPAIEKSPGTIRGMVMDWLGPRLRTNLGLQPSRSDYRTLSDSETVESCSGENAPEYIEQTQAGLEKTPKQMRSQDTQTNGDVIVHDKDSLTEVESFVMEQNCPRDETEISELQLILTEKETALLEAEEQIYDIQLELDEAKQKLEKQKLFNEEQREADLQRIDELEQQLSKLTQLAECYQQERDEHASRLIEVQQRYQKAKTENKKLYNLVQDLRGSIRVFCRVRPPSVREAGTEVVRMGSEPETQLTLRTNAGGVKTFTFDRVFHGSSTQDHVYEELQELIRVVCDGYNVCIFAYGQTGAGKTWTMSGPGVNKIVDESQQGLIFRALEDLFALREARQGEFQYTVHVQCVEIYNEQVKDLLAPAESGGRKVDIRLGEKGVSSVPDATQEAVESPADVFNVMKRADSCRSVGSTAMNERSSRSHSVTTVMVAGIENATGIRSHGCLHLIDLAGSERVLRSEAQGERLKEAQHINKSLSALGDVIAALQSKSAHVPYRNSKLTMLLQDSLGGAAKCLMFAHISPAEDSAAESLSTLYFAERVATVQIGAAKKVQHSNVAGDALERADRLAQELKEKNAELEAMSRKHQQGDEECKRLEAENAELLERASSAEQELQLQKRLYEELAANAANPVQRQLRVRASGTASTGVPQSGHDHTGSRDFEESDDELLPYSDFSGDEQLRASSSGRYDRVPHANLRTGPASVSSPLADASNSPFAGADNRFFLPDDSPAEKQPALREASVVHTEVHANMEEARSSKENSGPLRSARRTTDSKAPPNRPLSKPGLQRPTSKIPTASSVRQDRPSSAAVKKTTVSGQSAHAARPTSAKSQTEEKKSAASSVGNLPYFKRPAKPETKGQRRWM